MLCIWADKIVGLRIFHDEAGKMNCSLAEVGGSLLVVSQFTLYGDCRKGRRPGFDQAAPPEEAKSLYEYFLFSLPSKRADGGGRGVSGGDACHLGERRASYYFVG